MNGYNNRISRRGFMGTISGATALALLGLDRKAVADRIPDRGLITDYVGRLCYNENPLGPSQAAIEAIQNEAGMAHRYPDWFAESLATRLSSHFDIPSNKIICGCGATEIIRLSAMVLSNPGSNVVAPYPSYGQFPSDCQFFGASARYVDLDSDHRIDLEAMRDQVDSNTSAVCITNPNNPTATLLDPSQLSDFVDDLPPEVVTIIDEAYYHYISVPDYPLAVDMVRSGKNVIAIHTFSKVYGLAGARIGYAIGPQGIVSSMRAYQIYATVSRPSLEAAKVSLDAHQHITDTVDLANQTKEYCFGEFDRMGLQYIPSETNFFMVDVDREAGWVSSQLASRGIYVRTGWGMPHHLRVSTGTMDEMADFTTALEDILNELGAGNEPLKPRMTELLQAYPNPFNSSTRIKIYLPKAAETRLEVFDIRGRLVKQLVDRSLGAGEHSFIWNGTNYDKKSVSSGSYFYRLTSGDDVITRRMLLVK
jgi:histidinol-phosphate aminotransferase